MGTRLVERDDQVGDGVRPLDSSLAREFCSSCVGRYRLAIPWALVLAVALWEVVPHGRIVVWAIAVLLCQAFNQVLCGAFEKSSSVGNVGIFWRLALAASLATDGLVTGSAGVFLFPAGSMPHQFVLALFLSCVAGAATVTYAAYLPGCIVSVLLVMLPLCGTFFSQGSEFSITMGALLLLLAVALVSAGVRMHRVLLESLTLRFEKDKLVESLSKEKEKIEEINAELEAEMLERRLVDESLGRSEDRYRAVVEGQTELVCRLLADQSLSFVNEACTRYFGISSQDLLGRNFLQFVHPSDLETVRKFFDQVGNCSSSKVQEYRVDGSDGEIRWLQWSFRAIRDRVGQIIEFQGVGRDITVQRKAEETLQKYHEQLEQRVEERTAELQEMNRKLKQEIGDRIRAEKLLRDSEQRFRTIFEKARDCIFVKDRALNYTYLNPAMQAIFESSESDVIGLTDEDLYGLDQGSRLKSEDLRVLGGQVIEAEHALTFKGRELTFNCIKVPMMDSSGSIVGLCGIARDVTERLRTHRERQGGELEFKSGAMRSTLNQLRLAAKSDSLVLLLGESGSGKDFLARHLHRLSPRSGGPFFAINCAALASELAESELFGHEAGSFTGARTRKRGMLELAEGGTLLLNEIGELSLALQAKLLTFLDTRSFTRVGGEANIEVNARLIAATNRELRNEVEAGRFRHDLYHRLNVFTIQVPPLRDRPEELPLLIDNILGQLCAKLGYGEVPRMDTRCLAILSEYHWPGNVRELRNVLERALILSEGGKIKPEGILFLERQNVSPERDGWSHVVRFPKGSENLNDIAKEVKSELIKEALHRASGVKKDAASLLGISVDSFKHQSKHLEA